MSNLFNNPDNLVDMVRQVLSGKPIEEKKEELDPVNKKAVKKKFDDRKDKDIDNDGDVDSTDKYLHKRRKAISKEINEGEGDQPCPHCKAMINAAHCVKENKPCPECGGKINASHCEEVELDEENLEENAASIAKLKKAYEPMRGKKISPDNAKKLTAIVKKFDGNKDMLMKIAKADIPFVSDSAITRLIIKHNMKGAEIKAAMKEEVELDEAKDEDSDGEKMTAAQKKDMDGDGEKDKGEKKKKKKKDGEDDEPKADKINTEPETDEVKTMMSEDEMTDAQKAKLDKMKKKYEGGEMHKAMKAKYGDKADEVFYGKLTKMAMGESVEMNEAKKVTKREIRKLEDENEHGQVALKLAQSFGTPKEVTKIKEIMKRHDRQGSIEPKDQKERDAIARKYYKMAEAVDIDEAKQLHMFDNKKDAENKAKEIGGKVITGKGKSAGKFAAVKEEIKEANDEEKDTNLIMQLRKAVSLRGNKVKFADGKSVVVSDKDAQKFMGMFSKLKKPAEKEMMMKSAAKSHKHFKMALSGRVEKPKSGGPDLPKLKSEK